LGQQWVENVFLNQTKEPYFSGHASGRILGLMDDASFKKNSWGKQWVASPFLFCSYFYFFVIYFLIFYTFFKKLLYKD
jgi:hypothetical protein